MPDPSIQDLRNRYSRSRSTIYLWLKTLNIKTERIGNHAYISRYFIPKLDKLHAHLVDGGSIKEFLWLDSQQDDAQD